MGKGQLSSELSESIRNRRRDWRILIVFDLARGRQGREGRESPPSYLAVSALSALPYKSE